MNKSILAAILLTATILLSCSDMIDEVGNPKKPEWDKAKWDQDKWGN